MMAQSDISSGPNSVAESELEVALAPSQAVLYDIYILDTIFSFLSSTDIVSIGRTCRTALDAKRSYLRRAADDNRRISLFFGNRAAFRRMKLQIEITTPPIECFDEAYRSNTYRLVVKTSDLVEMGDFVKRVGYTVRPDLTERDTDDFSMPYISTIHYVKMLQDDPLTVVLQISRGVKLLL